METWRGTTAIVTGAGSGIGRALAQALAARGAFVVATDISLAAVAHTVTLFPSSGRAVLHDVRESGQWTALVEQVVAERGRLDLLVNNAGIGIAGEAKEFGLAHWNRVLEVNLHGVINGVLAAYPVMIGQRGGQIVNVASLAGLSPAPLSVPYATSKFAVVGLSTSLRVEAAHYGIRINVVCPAAIETPLLDAGNPSDLPPVSWRPDIRRYLTRLAGPPYPVERLAEEAIDAIERNQSVIVIPRRARLAWIAARLAPRLVERLTRAAVDAERGTW